MHLMNNLYYYLLQLCMYNTTKTTVGLGRYRGGPDWNINSLDPLNFTITYYGGDKISSATSYVLCSM